MRHDFNATLTKALYTATSGMQVQNKRVLVLSQNVANAGSRPAAPGQEPYRRRMISFKSTYDKKLDAEIVSVNRIFNDKSPLNRVYSPGDQAADKLGYVQESNVKPMIEMADLREAGIGHDANLKAFERVLKMLENTINLLKS